MSKTYPAIPNPTPDPESLRSSVAAIKETVEILTTSRAGEASKVATQQDVIDLSGEIDALADANDLGSFIESPANKDYVLREKFSFPFTILETTVRTRVGTCTVTFKIDGNAIGGAAHSASTIQNSIQRTAGNTGVVGSRLTATVSAVAGGCADLAIAVKYS